MTQIRATAPAKVILFGEWDVLFGGPCVVTTLDKYFSATALIDSSSKSLTLTSSEHQLQILKSELQTEQHLFFDFALSTLKKWGPSELSQLSQINFHRDWRLEEGLGSSSALFLCLELIRSELSAGSQKKQPRFFDLKEKMIGVFKKGSGADLGAQLLGGSVLFNISEGPSALKLKFPSPLKLLHTGRKRSTSAALNSSKFFASDFRNLRLHTEEFLKTQDFQKAIVHYSKELSRLGIMGCLENDISEELESLKIIETLKSTGAGGGDALLCWLKEGQEGRFHTYAKEKGFWIQDKAWEGHAAKVEVLE